MSLTKDYFDKTAKHIDEFGERTIVLMQVGAFFEVYGIKDGESNQFRGSNILEFSKICDLNVVDKKCCVGTVGTIGTVGNSTSQDRVFMAGFKDHLIDKYIKKLQDAGLTVVVYEQDENAPNTTRSLTGVYSSGTYISNDHDILTNSICCIWIETKKNTLKNHTISSGKDRIYIGVSVMDVLTGVSHMMEYNETYFKNPTTFDDLERFISIYNPSETILLSNLPQPELDDIISFANIQSKTIHIVSTVIKNDQEPNKNSQRAQNCEKQTYQIELLRTFYVVTDLATFMAPFNETVYATQSFCYLLDFIYQHNPNLVRNIPEPMLENTNSKLILANHSLKQLNIIDDDNYKGKYSSVVKMLNDCITPMGKRQFSNLFLNPVTDEDYLNEEYQIVEDIQTTLGTDYPYIKSILGEMKDISKITRQIMLQKVMPPSLYHIYQNIKDLIPLFEFLETRRNVHNYLLKRMPLDRLKADMDTLVQAFDTAFKMDECQHITNLKKIDNSFIQHGINTDLDNHVRTNTESAQQIEIIRKYLNDLILGYEKSARNKSEEFIKIHETEKNNITLISTDRRCKILETILKKHKDTTSTSTSGTISIPYVCEFSHQPTSLIFCLKDITFEKHTSSNRVITSNQINALCKNVTSTKIHMIDKVGLVYQDIVKDFQRFQPQMEHIIAFITYTDVVFCKAFIANKYNYCRPIIDTNIEVNSYIEAKNLRHCLIEKIQQNELYIGNDVTIGKGGVNGILLYGTNAVGKTSFIRSIGIAQIMAQAGMYVPASHYIYKPYKYIFTRILGNDNLFKGLSTFAVEMSELRSILRLANNRSLVLGDELCSGTESISAVSIFVSGIQWLSRLNCSFFFATHLHEIIHFDEITSLTTVSIKHMSVIYDKERDCLIYNRKLQDGPGINMYGLEVCKSLSLPADFLENAHAIRVKYHPEVGSILDNKASHYNAKHVAGGVCEKCNQHPAIDVHHMLYQKQANDKGAIQVNGMGLYFDKNSKANLMNLCEKCHHEVHKKKKIYKKTKTTIGMIIEEL